ncbi:MAG: tRNA 2-thiocytidine biosynthesis TtcA family protein [Oscillospiraceae bacterium]
MILLARQLEKYQLIERSIIKKYRSELWNPFIAAIKKYQLLEEGDRVAVCISGGKDSMLMAKLFQELSRHSDFPFEARYLVLDPGYRPETRKLIEENAELMRIPIEITECGIFRVAEDMAGDKPCYMCARMRRGALYSTASGMGCNKIALGHHLNDVIETVLMGMFYSSELQTMLPKVKSENFEGMELIRPLYRIKERDIIRWARYNGLSFIKCACSVTEKMEDGSSKRQEVKQLIEVLRKTNPGIEDSIFHSLHTVNTDLFPGFRAGGEEHSFLERYQGN